MSFGEQIKAIRAEKGLTQEQMAVELSVSRQAVSNWENGRNLPDIEILIAMATKFGLSLDRLILGEINMNEMTEKLIRDGSEARRARMNLITACIGAVLLLIGVELLIIKAFSVEYVDAEGILHENFFLLPIAFLFLFAGFITFLISGIKNAVNLKRLREDRSSGVTYMLLGAGVVLLCTGGLLMLIASNSGASLTVPGGVLAICGLLTFAGLAVRAIVKAKRK